MFDSQKVNHDLVPCETHLYKNYLTTHFDSKLRKKEISEISQNWMET